MSEPLSIQIPMEPAVNDELGLLCAMVNLLERQNLEPDERRRLLTYLTDRYKDQPHD